jgi:energy-coupling factor transport system substrate-specific component
MSRSRPSPMVLLASMAGAGALFYPFFLPLLRPGRPAGHGVEVPLLFAVIAGACLLTIVLEVQRDATAGDRSASKLVALLGVLVATDAALRLLPSLLGASPIFLLIILVGYSYGANFGFLMGALTLLVSALITGGLGPWLPYQMLTSGWVGLTAGLLPRPRGRREIVLLTLFGALWGFLFGAVMNLWEWPFAAPGLQQQAGLYWTPGMGAVEAAATYARYYLVTSLVYDLFRAAGNLLLVVFLARPILDLLDRFRERFSWQPWIDLDQRPEQLPSR